MNYSDIINTLSQSSGFDLFRIKTAINHMLDNPELVQTVKRMIQPGQNIDYFEPKENRAVSAHIISINRTTVTVQNHDDQKVWKIPYYFINIHGIDTHINVSKKSTGLTKNEIKVDDIVGFYNDRDQSEVYGKVARLNKKTVTLNTPDGHKWRVSYSYLFNIHTSNLEVFNLPDSDFTQTSVTE